MNKNSPIYITGHAGLIGSAILRKLNSLGYKKIIVRTHDELNLIDTAKVKAFFAEEKPEYVFLAAARVGGIHANNTYPAEFIYDNIMIQTNVIDLAYRYGVKKLLFLASSCVYPKACKQPMKEKYLFSGPLEPTNEAFGVAKLAGITMCQAYNRQYATNFISVIPGNVYGPNDHLDKDAHVISALILRFHQAKAEGKESVVIWGSGKPKREFLYVDDLANACVFLMHNYVSSEIINTGSSAEISIRGLASLIKKITGFKGKIIYDTSKPDGNLRRALDSTRIRKLGWKPEINLREGLALTYDWFRKARREQK